MAHAAAQRGLRRVQGTHGIDQHAFGDVVLDKRHMLVRRRMIDSVHPPATHHILCRRAWERTEPRMGTRRPGSDSRRILASSSV